MMNNRRVIAGLGRRQSHKVTSAQDGCSHTRGGGARRERRKACDSCEDGQHDRQLTSQVFASLCPNIRVLSRIIRFT